MARHWVMSVDRCIPHTWYLPLWRSDLYGFPFMLNCKGGTCCHRAPPSSAQLVLGLSCFSVLLPVGNLEMRAFGRLLMRNYSAPTDVHGITMNRDRIERESEIINDYVRLSHRLFVVVGHLKWLLHPPRHHILTFYGHLWLPTVPRFQ